MFRVSPFTRFLFYLTYALVLLLVLAYIRFPTEKFKAYCEKNIEYLLPDRRCQIGRISFLFPLGIIFKNIELSGSGKNASSVILVDTLGVSPVFKQFWRSVSIEGDFYEGSFSMQLDHNFKEKSFHLQNVSVNDVSITKVIENMEVPDRKITGFINYSGDYKGGYNNIREGTGVGVLQIATCTMEMIKPVLSQTELNFEEIIVDMTYNSSAISFTNGQITGNEFGGEFTGTLKTVSPLRFSTIAFSGLLDPRDSFLKKYPQEQKMVQRLMNHYKTEAVPFRLGGTVNRPTFRFSK